MRSAKKLLVALAILLCVLGVLAAAVGILFEGTNQAAEDWYVQIDNSLVTEITPHGGMNYRYTLTAYDNSGKSQTMNFDTSRVLRDGAYIRLAVAPIRGIISWEEVEEDQLPVAVRAQLPQ